MQKILVVEDDSDDRELLCEAVLDYNPLVQFAIAENGRQALDYLNGAKRGDEQFPCLIVLDINMPFLNGHATFDHIRADNTLPSIPIIIFTSSESPADMEHFTSLGVEFISKPSDYKILGGIARHMVQRCCGIPE